MEVSGRTLIGELLEASPEVRELLTWYGIDLEDIAPATRLDDLCSRLSLNLDDLCVELEVLFFDLDRRLPR